jgi:hypothetical protein
MGTEHACVRLCTCTCHWVCDCRQGCGSAHFAVLCRAVFDQSQYGPVDAAAFTAIMHRFFLPPGTMSQSQLAGMCAASVRMCHR